MSVDWAALKVGDAREYVLDEVGRSHFVRYAGASGDFNPIHTDENVARAAGLDGVFGQGMFTAGVLGRIPAEWFGPESIRRYAVRFQTRVWPGDRVTFRGVVERCYDEDGLPHADLALSAVNQDGAMLVRGEATVRPWSP